MVPSMRDNVSAYIDALITWADELDEKPVLFISSDEHCVVVNSNADRLRDHIAYPYLDEETMARCINKHVMFRAARAAGVPVPATVFVSSPSDAGEALETMRYPAVVKPASWVQHDSGVCRRNSSFIPAFGQKAVRAVCRQDLEPVLNRALSLEETVVVQQEIVGDCSGIWGVSLYANSAGDIWISHSLQKTRQYPSDFGTGSCMTPQSEPVITQLSTDLVRAVSFQGIAEIEFKRHEDTGDYYLMEINPRPGTWITASSVNGVNTPFIAYCDLADLPIPETSEPDVETIWVDSWYDTMYFLRYRKGDHTGRSLSWKEWRRSLRRPREGAYFTTDDPLPGLRRAWDLGCTLAGAGWRRIARRLNR